MPVFDDPPEGEMFTNIEMFDMALRPCEQCGYVTDIEKDSVIQECFLDGEQKGTAVHCAKCRLTRMVFVPVRWQVYRAAPEPVH